MLPQWKLIRKKKKKKKKKEGTINLFGIMFPNGKTAANMELRRKILKYIINHGFSPYFKNFLTENLVSSDSLSVSFDESLNKLLKVVI